MCDSGLRRLKQADHSSIYGIIMFNNILFLKTFRFYNYYLGYG